jgi:hypothetical protein
LDGEAQTTDGSDGFNIFIIAVWTVRKQNPAALKYWETNR